MNRIAPKKAMNIRIEEKVFRKLEKIAKKNKLSVSALVRQYIYENMKK